MNKLNDKFQHLRWAHKKLSCPVVARVHGGETLKPAMARPMMRLPYNVRQMMFPDICAAIPYGTPGRVGELADLVNKGTRDIKYCKQEWSPPYEYEFYARLKIPENEREAYLKRCEEWFATNPPKAIKSTPPVEYNHEMIAKFWKGKTSMPSIEDRLAVLHSAGIPDILIEKHEKWDQKMEETSEKRQKQIDDIFGKYNKTKTKAVSKTPKMTKTIKPVKKKIV